MNVDALINVLDTISFLLVTPELLGPERLKRYGDDIHRMIEGRIGDKWRKDGVIYSIPHLVFASVVLPLSVTGMYIVTWNEISSPAHSLWDYARYSFLVFIDLVMLMPLVGVAAAILLVNAILRKFYVTRVMLVIGAMLFFATRAIAIRVGLQHGA